MAVQLKVTFPGDRVEIVMVTPRAQVNTERFLKGIKDVSAIEAGYRLAFESLMQRRMIDTAMGYEEFLDTILEVEDLAEDTEAENPTTEALSPTASSD